MVNALKKVANVASVPVVTDAHHTFNQIKTGLLENVEAVVPQDFKMEVAVVVW